MQWPEKPPDRGTSHDVPDGQWIARLDSPCGVFCWNDDAAAHFICTAQDAGLRVPEQLAVVGLHNDELMCEMTRPGISSVELPLDQVGYEAAALLDRMMAGEPAPAEPLRLPPLRVVERGSTRTVAVADPLVAEVLSILRRHATERITVDQVCEQLSTSVSRRTMERRFRDVVGRSPNAELRRLRCQHAADLMRSTDLSLDEVARQCGFQSQPYFSDTFHKVMGERPGQYRREASRRGIATTTET